MVVSGLPRSGTSLVMQMLEAGGVPILSDGAREADEDNPRGYYELEAAKRIREDARFLEDAAGLAVKVVAPLVDALPEGPSYRVVFIERRIESVLASQHAMMVRRGTVDGAPDGAMTTAFRERLEGITGRLVARSDVDVRFVTYEMLVRLPEIVAGRIAEFLGLPDDRIGPMAACVDPGLERSRGD